MSPLKDIRIECEDMPTPGYALQERWPCAPEGVEDARSSGLICATVVARTMWSLLKPQCWPEPGSTEDAITAYTFVDFREDQPGLKEALREIWNKARDCASRQQGGETDDSFAGICRSPGFVKAFWANPRFRLTTPHWKAGFGYNGRQTVLDGALARQAVVAWDGVEPATVKAAVDNQTFKKYGNWGGMTFAYFMGPMLLQVDFTPAEGSEQSLADIQTFSAKKWAFVKDPSGILGGKWELTSQIPYTIMAIVLHRETEDGVDSVRLFGSNGREQLPAAQTGPVQWPFALDEAVPAGRKITLLYNSVPPDTEVYDCLRRSERFPKLPTDLEMKIKAPVGALATNSDRQMEYWVQKITTHTADTWPQLLTLYETVGPQAHRASNTSSTRPAGRSDNIPAQNHPVHDGTSKPRPTEPRIDRGTKRRTEDDEETGRDDYKRPKLTDNDALPRSAAIEPPSLTGADAQGASRNGTLPGESNRGVQKNLGPQRNHAAGLEMITPQSRLPPQPDSPGFRLPAGAISRARPQFPLLSSVSSPQPSYPISPAPAPAAGRGSRRGNKKSSGKQGRT